MFLSLGYLLFNRERILSAANEKTARLVCEEEQTIHIGKYCKLVSKLQNKYRRHIRYPLKNISKDRSGEDQGHRNYEELQCPPDAVRMHETKGKIVVEELRKQREAEAHREQMIQDMKTMTINARRESERQALEQQAYKMHCEQQQDYKVQLTEVNRTERIKMLEAMMN